MFLACQLVSPASDAADRVEKACFPAVAVTAKGSLSEQETVRVHVPPMVGDGTLMEVPLRGLGVHDFYLRVHIRVAYEAGYGPDFR